MNEIIRKIEGTEVVLRTSKMKEEHNERNYQKNRS